MFERFLNYCTGLINLKKLKGKQETTNISAVLLSIYIYYIKIRSRPQGRSQDFWFREANLGLNFFGEGANLGGNKIGAEKRIPHGAEFCFETNLAKNISPSGLMGFISFRGAIFLFWGGA